MLVVSGEWRDLTSALYRKPIEVAEYVSYDSSSNKRSFPGLKFTDFAGSLDEKFFDLEARWEKNRQHHGNPSLQTFKWSRSRIENPCYSQKIKRQSYSVQLAEELRSSDNAYETPSPDSSRVFKCLKQGKDTMSAHVVSI